MFSPVDPKQSFSKLELEILKFWKEEKIFEQSLEKTKYKKPFVFYDGPPFATGTPHYGHILQGTLKDVFPRYWTMKGRYVERKWGWDCHGLPVENIVEKMLGTQSKKDIEKMGVAAFNEKCKQVVLDTSEEWSSVIDRMGRWVDFKNPYRTMDTNYIESVWWVLKQLWDKDLVYEGFKSMHVCPRCETPLSNFEVGLGYKDITDCSVTAKFKIKEMEDTYFLAWTTTPWTLPGNVALAVGKDIDYVMVSTEGKTVILAKDIYSKMEAFGEVTKEVKGKDLLGLSYEPVFDYFKQEYKDNSNIWKVYHADFVDTEQGTGIVHIASGYGEDDYQLSLANNLPLIQHVKMDGTYVEEITDFAGEAVKPSDDPRKMDQKIADALEKKELLFVKENFKHSYPHCWRCETPLLNYATSCWYVKVTKIKEMLVENNKKVHWVPDAIGHGRFQNWLENARDWAISRNRYWGAPLPIWKCEETGEILCISSKQELEDLSGRKFDDLHKQFLDDVVIEKDGKEFRRTPDVFDCWFESGSMPYAQNHYPFENKEQFESSYPADFIAEGQDQTRGWFYTLTVLSNALFGASAFKNVIVTGVILAEDGKKMSKRLKNYPDPKHVFDTYGADAMRLYLISSPVVKSDDLRFSEKGIDQLLKSFFLPLWNSYSFFITYGNIDQFVPDKDFNYETLSHDLDRWIVCRLHETLKAVDESMSIYELQDATKPLASFLDDLTNWYIRRSRRRFWKTENDHDKKEAYQTLWYVLKEFTTVIAPFTPFIADAIYKNLTGETSVHLVDFPVYNEAYVNMVDTKKVQDIQTIVSLGHKLRSETKMKVRQPLASMEVYYDGTLDDSETSVILEELNIKTLTLVSNPESLAEKVCKPLSKVLGPRLGTEMQKVIQAVREGKYEMLADGRVQVGSEMLETNEYELEYQGKEDRIVAADLNIVVSLDTHLTPTLIQEGEARDFVRLIQELRKEADFQVSDHISIGVSGSLTQFVEHEWKSYILGETLADTIQEGELKGVDFEKETEEGKVWLKRI